MKQGDHEHLEFEKFAESKKLDRIMHPLHLLYLDNKTGEALMAFKAGYEAGKNKAPDYSEHVCELNRDFGGKTCLVCNEQIS